MPFNLSSRHIDILMITQKRPQYTQMALSRLLETCDENMRVWIWHNGGHEPTLEVVKILAQHPCVHEFYHSTSNQRLNKPTNWLMQNSRADYVSKVDDDCLMPQGWGRILQKAHEDVPEFGVIGCWRFTESDFYPELARCKIKTFSGRHQLMVNCWIEGSGYLMKKECVDQFGIVKPGQSFPQYCIRLAAKGFVNGWYYPFLYQEHFDHPWSKHSRFQTDADFMRDRPLMAQRRGIKSLEEYAQHFRDEARRLQTASPDPRHYVGWRSVPSRLRRRFRRIFGGATHQSRQ